jgi:hypothetical protein
LEENFFRGLEHNESEIEKETVNIIPLGILFQDIDLLKGLEDLALDRAAGVDVVAGAGTAVNTATVELSEGTNTNAGAKVDVAGNRGYKKRVSKERNQRCQRLRSFAYQRGCRTSQGHREQAPCRCQS